jgi:hypothetical protein
MDPNLVTMDTIDLTLILARLFSKSQTNFLGVLASDRIPSLRTVATFAPCCYVLNTDPKSEPGTHWVAIYHATPRILEFFDSYGSHPNDYGIFFDTSLQLRFNEISFQTVTSSVCGQYCIFFLAHRTNGHSFQSIQRHLASMSRTKSDQLVYSFVHDLSRRMK